MWERGVTMEFEFGDYENQPRLPEVMFEWIWDEDLGGWCYLGSGLQFILGDYENTDLPLLEQLAMYGENCDLGWYVWRKDRDWWGVGLDGFLLWEFEIRSCSLDLSAEVVKLREWTYAGGHIFGSINFPPPGLRSAGNATTLPMSEWIGPRPGENYDAI
jgi:hypothetical protein